MLIRSLAILFVMALMPAVAETNSPPAPLPSAAASARDASIAGLYGGSASCRDCHLPEFQLWANSHHGLAERPVKPAVDGMMFDPARTLHFGSQTTEVCVVQGQYQVKTTGLSGHVETFPVERVLGVSPLRQFLVPFPGGRYQTLEASYDPRTNDWFDSFGTEDRHPGEWGHWTGRGMNWNQMCAVCHNTRVLKNYDVTNDSYHTTMVEPSVGCEACHGPLRAHNEWQKQFGKTAAKDPTVKKPGAGQMLDYCGTCHSRRGDLTGDFVPGQNFGDHYNLEMAGTEDYYYSDGQIREEDYEFASFQGSKMAHAGITCLDCHNPHSMKNLVTGNQLCLRCHGGGRADAPKIDPVAHSHHQVHGYATNGVPLEDFIGSYDSKQVTETGGECINCHMPQTPYMQRHWRHDHGFTSPDPLLTKQFGIPNACNRCHQDKSADWALEASVKWYGAALDNPRRQRAQTFARANKGDETAVPGLLGVLHDDPVPYWRAAAANALAQWSGAPGVTAGLLQQLANTNALVRTKAAQALDQAAQSQDAAVLEALRARLQDPIRSVRLAAAWGLRTELKPADPVTAELETYLNLNADQPAGQLQLGVYALDRGSAEAALPHYEKAVQWDAYSGAARRELAVVDSLLNRPADAVKALQEAVRLSPREAQYQFELGLAWNEAGDLAAAQSAFETAVKIAPKLAPAWYNLGLARAAAGQPDTAIAALLQAEAANPADARAPYARATILVRQGKYADAKKAAQRAVEIRPDFPEARELLNRLSVQ